jgi:trimethylamine corrinoid protein
MATIEDLKKIVFEFDMDNAEAVAHAVISSGVDPMEASKALTEAIRQIGDDFSKGDLFLPDLACASEVLKKALPIIIEEMEKKGSVKESTGKVLIGTVFGDIHSIGKSMVSTLLYAAGFDVIDLGVNVKSEDFIGAVKKYDPDVLAMSALLTTTASEQKNVIEGLKKQGLRQKLKIIVGGSPINQEFADAIGADGYGATAPDGVKVVRYLLGLQ